MDSQIPAGKNNLPEVPPLRKLIGPSFIILGVGLGSGELILWPYLSSNFGLGIIWAALVGITFQFFINMEIERYTLVTGESIFVGMRRKFGDFTPYWFMGTTLIPWMWPGIIASSAKVLSTAMGFEYSGYIGIILLIALGALYSFGSIVYKTQERVQKAIILVGIPFVFVITAFLAKGSDWLALGKGIVGIGEGYRLLPIGLPFATFLGALAYAGAGGNLNLAQSFYVKEKGYGMGKYSGKLTNILSGKKENLELEGATFENTPENLDRFKRWWRSINFEHGVVFWITGAFTMLLLSLLAYSTVRGASGIETSINFVVFEANAIATRTFPQVATLFLVIVGVMLFGTQFSVYGSNARIASENFLIGLRDKLKMSNPLSGENLNKYFYLFLWIQILAGVVILALGFTEPLTLVVTGAVLNAISMFIYSGLVLLLNLTSLPKEVRPSLFRTLAVLSAFLFYGAFSIFTVYRFFANA